MSASLDKIPIELLHRIFDFLDSPTLVFKIRPVSKRLRSVVISYDRYKFNSQSVSKEQFFKMCVLIPTDHVISLTLSGDCSKKCAPADLFLSLKSWPPYTRLQSLNLFSLSEYQMHHVLARIEFNCIQTFSLHVSSVDEEYMQKTPILLASILTKPKLNQVELNLMQTQLPRDKWTAACVFEHLILHYITDINHLFSLLDHCPFLHTLVIKRLTFSTHTVPTTYFRQLKSWTIDHYNGDIHGLEPMLMCAPDLTHLRIRGRKNVFSGHQWERFVRNNLTQLISFEFDLYIDGTMLARPEEIILIMNSFRSPFWLKEKKWFVHCSCSSRYDSQAHLYLSSNSSSIPDESFYSSGFSLSTNSTMINDENTLTINANRSFLQDLENQSQMDELPFFHGVKQMKIRFMEEHITHTLRRLWQMVNISELVHIELEDYSLFENNEHVLNELKKILHQATQLSVLIFRLTPGGRLSSVAIEKIISILPFRFDYLSIPTISQDHINMIHRQTRDLKLMRMISRFSQNLTEEFEEQPTQVYVETTFVSYGYTSSWSDTLVN